MCCIYGNTSALIRHLASDPFVIAATRRAYFRVADLIRLAEQIRELLG
jgi:hypothetical protein